VKQGPLAGLRVVEIAGIGPGQSKGGQAPPSGTPPPSGTLRAPAAHPSGSGAGVWAISGRWTHMQGGAHAYGYPKILL
jgi:hypothetical protein